MNAIIYTKLTDHINISTYQVEAPAYANFEASEFTDGILDRFYSTDKNHMVLTRATIADMVDMVDKVIPFKILKSDDVIEVFSFLSRYMIELQQYVEFNEEAKIYYPRCEELKRWVERSINILANQGIRKAIEIRRQYGVESYFKLMARGDE